MLVSYGPLGRSFGQLADWVVGLPVASAKATAVSGLLIHSRGITRIAAALVASYRPVLHAGSAQKRREA